MRWARTALPYAPVDFLKAPLEHALERGLGRKIDVDSVSLTLFAGPGFALDGVTIHEDPRAGDRAVRSREHTGRAPRSAGLAARAAGVFEHLNLNDATFNLVKAGRGAVKISSCCSTKPAPSGCPRAEDARRARQFQVWAEQVHPVFRRHGSGYFARCGEEASISASRGPRRVVIVRRKTSGISLCAERRLRRAPASGSICVLNWSPVRSTPSLCTCSRRARVDLKGIVSLDAQVAGEPSRPGGQRDRAAPRKRPVAAGI